MVLEEEDETGEVMRRDEGSNREYGPPLASRGESENPKFMLVGVRGMDPLPGCPGNWKKFAPAAVGEFA